MLFTKKINPLSVIVREHHENKETHLKSNKFPKLTTKPTSLHQHFNANVFDSELVSYLFTNLQIFKQTSFFCVAIQPPAFVFSACAHFRKEKHKSLREDFPKINRTR